MTGFNLSKFLRSCEACVTYTVMGFVAIMAVFLPFVISYYIAGTTGLSVFVSFLFIVAMINFLKWKTTGHYFVDE